jgi:DNA-damage-inducible protein D
MDSREIEKRRLVFDDYSRKDEDGVEYWLARDIMKPLGYSRWENFNKQ